MQAHIRGGLCQEPSRQLRWGGSVGEEEEGREEGRLNGEPSTNRTLCANKQTTTTTKIRLHWKSAADPG